jgi:hypothetical protein
MFAAKLRHPFAATALLALAAAFLPARAAAQSPASSLPKMKMFQPLQSRPSSPAAAPAAPTLAPPPGAPRPSAAHAPVQVTLTFPTVPDAAFVAVRGTDGVTRYFPVKGGSKELATRVIVVRPGERVSIQLPLPNPK